MNKNKTMLPICVYCDTTGLFTETECDCVNMIDMFFPAWLIEEWYKEHEKEFIEECKAEGIEPNCYNWYTEVYTADDTIGLYDFAVKKRATRRFSYELDTTRDAVVYENENGEKVVVYKGTYTQCRQYGRMHKWKYTRYYMSFETLQEEEETVDLEMLFGEIKGDR